MDIQKESMFMFKGWNNLKAGLGAIRADMGALALRNRFRSKRVKDTLGIEEATIDWRKTGALSLGASVFTSFALTASGTDTPTTYHWQPTTKATIITEYAPVRTFPQKEVTTPGFTETIPVSNRSGEILLPDSRSFNLATDGANYIINPNELDSFVKDLINLRIKGFTPEEIVVTVNASDEAILQGPDANLGIKYDGNDTLSKQYGELVKQELLKRLAAAGIVLPDDAIIIETSENILTEDQINEIRVMTSKYNQENMSIFIDKVKTESLVLSEEDKKRLDELLKRSAFITASSTLKQTFPGITETTTTCVDEVTVTIKELENKHNIPITLFPMVIPWVTLLRRRNDDYNNETRVTNPSEQTVATTTVTTNDFTLNFTDTTVETSAPVSIYKKGYMLKFKKTIKEIIDGAIERVDDWANDHSTKIKRNVQGISVLALASVVAGSNFTYCEPDRNSNDIIPNFPNGIELGILHPTTSPDKVEESIRLPGPIDASLALPDWVDRATLPSIYWRDCDTIPKTDPKPPQGPVAPECGKTVITIGPNGERTTTIVKEPKLFQTVTTINN